MKGIQNGDQFYFVHSFHVVVEDQSLSCLRTTYGYEFVSGIIHQNCVATQFHPEKIRQKVCKFTEISLKRCCLNYPY